MYRFELVIATKLPFLHSCGQSSEVLGQTIASFNPPPLGFFDEVAACVRPECRFLALERWNINEYRPMHEGQQVVIAQDNELHFLQACSLGVKLSPETISSPQFLVIYLVVALGNDCLWYT